MQQPHSPDVPGRDEQLSILQAYARALDLEAGAVSQRPAMLWQQLFNRLQRDGDVPPAALASALGQRSTPGAGAWLRRLTAPVESSALIRTLVAHETGVWSCAITPDAGYILTGDSDGIIKIWNAATGAEALNLEGHVFRLSGRVMGSLASVSTLVVSPLGDLFVSVGQDRSIQIRDLRTGTARPEIRSYRYVDIPCAISPDGTFMVTGGDTKTLEVRDLPSGQLRPTILRHEAELYGCAISPDGRTIVSASGQSALTFWDSATLQLVRTLPIATHQYGMTTTFAITPDGQRLLSGGPNGTVCLWDLETGERIWSLPGNAGGVSCSAISPDGAVAITGAWETSAANVWDLERGQLLATLDGHTNMVRDCAISPDGRFAVTASDDRTARVWDLQRVSRGRAVARRDPEIDSLTFSPDGGFFVTVSARGRLARWDGQSGHDLGEVADDGDSRRGIAISPDGRAIAYGSFDGSVIVRDTHTGDILARLRQHTERVTTCVISPDGDQLVAISEDLATVWDWGTWQPWAPMPSASDERLVSLAGDLLAMVDQDRVLTIRDATTGAARCILSGNREQTLSPDGTFVVHPGKISLTIWGHGSGGLLGRLRAMGGHPTSICLSPDGERLAAVDATSGLLEVWSLLDGDGPHALPAHSGTIHMSAFSPDGTLLAVSTAEQEFKIWNVRTRELVTTLSGSGPVRALAFNPCRPALAYAEWYGEATYFELSGFAYGPLAVAAVQRGSALTVTCPRCRARTGITRAQLGTDLVCSRAACAGGIHANRLAVGAPSVTGLVLGHIRARWEDSLREPIVCCAVSADGSLVAAGGSAGAFAVWDGASGQRLTSGKAHRQSVTACAISMDGTLAVSADESGVVAIWNLPAGDLRAGVPGHRAAVRACAISPDASFVVTAGDDRALRVWESKHGQERVVMLGHAGPVTACAISPDGRTVVSGGDDGTLLVWDRASGGERSRLAGHRARVERCTISPDGRTVVSTAEDRTVRVWDLAAGAQQSVFQHGGTRAAISPDGLMVAAKLTTFVKGIGERESVIALDLTTGEQRTMAAETNVAAFACAIGPAGGALVALMQDGNLRAWDPSSGQSVARRWLVPFQVEQTCLALASAAPVAVVGSSDGSLQVVEFVGMDIRRGERPAEPARRAAPPQLRQGRHTGHIDACQISPDGRFAVTTSRAGTLKVWDVQTGAERATLFSHGRKVSACAVSPDSRLIVSAGDDHMVRVWDAETGHRLYELAGHEEDVTACAVGPDSSFAVSAGHDGAVIVWDLATGRLRTRLGMNGWLWDCAISPDGNVVAAGGSATSVRLWDRQRGTARHRLMGHNGTIYTCPISPDGSFIVSASGDGTVVIWDLETGAKRATLDGRVGKMITCAISPDARLIAWTAEPKPLRSDDPPTAETYVISVWDVQTGHERFRRRMRRTWGRSCTFTADSTAVVVGDTAGYLNIWDAATGDRTLDFDLGSPVTCVAASPDPTVVVCGHHDGTVSFVQLPGG